MRSMTQFLTSHKSVIVAWTHHSVCHLLHAWMSHPPKRVSIVPNAAATMTICLTSSHRARQQRSSVGKETKGLGNHTSETFEQALTKYSSAILNAPLEKPCGARNATLIHTIEQ